MVVGWTMTSCFIVAGCLDPSNGGAKHLDDVEWGYYSADESGTRYSPLSVNRVGFSGDPPLLHRRFRAQPRRGGGRKRPGAGRPGGVPPFGTGPVRCIVDGSIRLTLLRPFDKLRNPVGRDVMRGISLRGATRASGSYDWIVGREPMRASRQRPVGTRRRKTAEGYRGWRLERSLGTENRFRR